MAFEDRPTGRLGKLNGGYAAVTNGALWPFSEIRECPLPSNTTGSKWSRSEVRFGRKQTPKLRRGATQHLADRRERCSELGAEPSYCRSKASSDDRDDERF